MREGTEGRGRDLLQRAGEGREREEKRVREGGACFTTFQELPPPGTNSYFSQKQTTPERLRNFPIHVFHHHHHHYYLLLYLHFLKISLDPRTHSTWCHFKQFIVFQSAYRMQNLTVNAATSLYALKTPYSTHFKADYIRVHAQNFINRMLFNDN